MARPRRRKWGGRRGVAALEFALLAPALVVLVLGLYDVTAAVIAWWQISAAAAAVARIASTYAATPTNTNVLSTTQAQVASTAIYAVMTKLKTAPAAQFGVTMSSVVMAPTVNGCTSNCTYVGNIAWSVAEQGTAGLRPCGQPSPVADTAPSSLTTLPVDAFTASPVLVVDIRYDFTPLFTTFFAGSLQFLGTAYLATRTGPDSAWVHLTGPNSAQAQCPGYTG